MKPRQERIEHIKKVFKTANEDQTVQNFYSIKNWRGKPLFRKVISLDSEYLMFRVENSRTEIQQLSFIRSNSLPANFFTDPESAKAQEAQEKILLDMVKGKGKELLDDLKLRKQEDPCIITYDGFIVNGNRRTSGLKFIHERYIECVVLPEDATPKDIYSLEQQLQISKDFKENYHWINELRNIRRGVEDPRYNFEEEELALNLRMEVPELRMKIRMIELVDAFLIWKKSPGQYDDPKLDDAEEVFRQLEKGLKRYKNDPAKQKALQNGIFILVQEKPSEGRLYGYVTYFIKTFDQTFEKMTSANPSVAAKPEEKKTNNGNILEELIEYSSTPNLFEDPDKAKEMSAKIVETIADVKAENKEKKDVEAVYDGVSRALRELQGLAIDDDTAKMESIKNKLDQLIIVANRLLVELQTHSK